MAGYSPDTGMSQQAAPTNEEYAKSLWDKTTQQYPMLKGKDIPFIYNPQGGAGYLETWAKGESGGTTKRPSQFPLDKYGIEVRSPDTGPREILGDYLSHIASKVDEKTGKPEEPEFYKMYKDFEKTMDTPEMKKRLEADYKYEKKEQEKLKKEGKPYLDLGTKEHYIKENRIPAYMRGYVTDQWEPEWNEQWVSPKQKPILDAMKNYVTGANQ